MNKKIKALNKKLADIQGDVSGIEMQLQAAWNDVFKDMTQLGKAVAELEQSNEYGVNEYGDIYSWIRFYTKEFKECQAYLVDYMRDAYCVEIDFQNDTLMMNHGNDNLIIQDDTRRDNGVWQGHKLVIAESDYSNEDGEVDTAKRNELIEAHMERTGYFPGVFRIDYHGNVFVVNTKEGI